MADIVKLKKKAADLEAKKQIDKALDVYLEIVDAYEAGDEDSIDIPLYNRVGDMLQKASRLPDAVSVWEKAVDRYTEGGFFNPAIALCNKILRASPGRTVIYYKLGKIHAEKGFKGDARQNFLEYATRQQKAGNLDDAFKALKEFAELVPDQYDVRLMLADQLIKAGRKDEAVDQLQLGYAQAAEDGKDDVANDIAAKMKEIDPSIEPKVEGRAASGGGGGLVFLDLDDGSPSAAPPRKPRTTGSIPSQRASKAIAGLALLEPAGLDKKQGTPVRPGTPAKPAEPTPAAASSDLIIESTSIGKDAPPPPRGSIAGLQATNLTEDVAATDIPILDVEPPSAASAVPLLDIEPPAAEAPSGPEISLLDVEPTSVASPDLPLIDAEPAVEPTSVPMLEIEPTSAANAPQLETLGEDPASVPLVEPEPSMSSDLPLLGVEPSIVEEVPRLSGEIEAVPATPSLEVESSVGAGITFDAPVADLPLVDDEAPIEEPETIPSQETLAIRASQGQQVVSDAVDEPVEIVEDASAAIVEDASVDLPLLDDAPVHVQVSIADLRAKVEAAPEDWTARRLLAEALLEQGDRSDALRELEATMAGFEQAGDLETAGSVAEEIVRLEPKSIRFHQKRVEFAFRSNDRVRLAEAYIELADALLADGQAQKARAVYQRVLDIRPDDLRAQAAIEAIPAEEAPSSPPPRRSTVAQPRPAAATPSTPASAAPDAGAAKQDDDDYVSLGDWLREDDEPKSTRMVVEEKEPTGDEQADFADMLRKFKQGVSENVEDEDHEAHYDLGVAYKEMGLLDEAIAEFQKALRGTKERVRTFEALGLCFVEKQQLPVAATILQRALAEPGVRDEALVGVLYLLGSIAEAQSQFADAKKHYERVFAVDIQFRDVGDRLNAVEQQLS